VWEISYLQRNIPFVGNNRSVLVAMATFVQKIDGTQDVKRGGKGKRE